MFVDSDVLLDILLKRSPFYFYTQLLLLESDKKNIKLDTSALVISNIHYVLSRSIGAAASRKNIKELLKTIKILSVDNDIIGLALDSNIADFEDAIQSLIAERYKCDAIITRNIKDYRHANLPVFTPEQFLEIL